MNLMMKVMEVMMIINRLHYNPSMILAIIASSSHSILFNQSLFPKESGIKGLVSTSSPLS